MNSATPLSSASSANGGLSLGSAEAAKFDLLWAQIAVIGITICLCNAIVYYPLRLGFYTPALLIPSCVLVFSSALLGPLLLPSGGALGDLKLRCVVMPMASLLVLAGVLAAFLLRSYALLPYVILCAAGAWRAVQLLKAESRMQLFFCVCVGCVVGLYLLCTVQSLNYAGLYSPEQSLLGTLNHDTTFHSSITYMIQNFGVPSTAIDGILPIKYHFGAHFWFAALGKLAASQPLFSFGAGVPIILAPMLVIALLLSVVSFDRGRRPLLIYALSGFGMIFMSDIIGWNSYYFSETYACGLIGLLLLLPLLCVLAEPVGMPPRQITLALAVAVAAIPLLLVLKISIGTLWTAALGWILLRRFGFSRQGLLGCLAAGGLFLLVALALSPSAQDYRTVSNHLIVPFFFFRLFPAAALACFLIPLVLLFSKTRLYGAEGLRATILSKSDLMFEAAMIVMIAGSIPPLLGIPQDSALWYFLNVAQWIAMVLLIVRFAPPGFPWPQEIMRARAFPLVIVAGLAVLTLTIGIYKQATAVLIAADEIGGGRLLNGQGALRYFREAMTREHVLWDSRFRAILASTAGGELTRMVKDAVPVPDRTTAVFVPPENEAFWTLFSGPRCLDKYNVQVSMTGQPSLLGGPPASYGCGFDAYTAEYGRQFLSHRISDADLCRHARERGFRRVMVIAASHASDRNRVLNCVAISS